jgi:hypothetical protein
MSGYAKMIPVGIDVRADTLEITAGYPDEHKVDRELAFAISALDMDDPDTLRWLACCIAAKLDYVESRERNPIVTP